MISNVLKASPRRRQGVKALREAKASPTPSQKRGRVRGRSDREMKGGARRLPELAGDDLRLPHPRRHRRRRDLAPKREGAGRQHLESSAATLCSSSCVRPLLQSSGSCPIHAVLPLLVGFLCSAFPSAGLLVAHWYLFLSRPLLCSLRHAWTLDMLCSCSSVLPEVGYEHTVV